MSRRTLLRGAAGVGALALAGCMDLAGLGGDEGGGKLRLAQAKSPIDLDPVVLNDVPSIEVAQQIFESPYQLTPDLDLSPVLATGEPEIEQDGQRWIVPLEPDAAFSNGDPVTVEDVRHSYTAPLAEETQNAAEVSMIDEISAVDETTVQFDLNYEFGAFRWYLLRLVVDKSVREEDRDAYNSTNPVGSGPFELQSFQEGESTVLTAREDYWGEPSPLLEEVELVPVEESTTRITTLQDGTNDAVKEIPPQSWETVQNMDGASISTATGVGYFYLGFNCADGPTAEAEVRRAIDLAFDMDEAVSRFVEPAGVRQYGPVPTALAEEWDLPVDQWESMATGQDVDEAKSILDDSDAVPADWAPTIIVPPDDMRENIGTSVVNGLQEAGYDATVQRLDWAQFIPAYLSGDADEFNAYTLGWSGAPDPDSFIYFLFSQQTVEESNGSRYTNDEMDAKITQARQSTDRAERRDLYAEVIDTLLSETVHVPAYNLRNSFGVRDTVSDFQSHPTEQFTLVTDWNNVSVE